MKRASLWVGVGLALFLVAAFSPWTGPVLSVVLWAAALGCGVLAVSAYRRRSIS